MGSRAILVEDPDGGPASWARGAVALAVPGVVDVVPAARTVLVSCTDAAALAGLLERLPAVAAIHDDHGADRLVVPVRYDGADLDAVASAIGATPAEVIQLHVGAEYRVAFCGFAPGFGYLDGLPERLHLPRRPTPRATVPAGSVAIASQYAAVYPRASPGGWHLLGTTDLVLFDPDRDPPALVSPGTVVTFEAVP